MTPLDELIVCFTLFVIVVLFFLAGIIVGHAKAIEKEREKYLNAKKEKNKIKWERKRLERERMHKEYQLPIRKGIK